VADTVLNSAVYGVGVYGTAKYGRIEVVVYNLDAATATGSIGSLTVNTTAGISGVSATGTIAPVVAGGFEIDISEVISAGVSATGAVNTVQVNVTEILDSASATGAIGTLAISNTVTLTGVQATGAINTVEEKPTEALSSVSATGQVGTVKTNVTEVVTGVEAEFKFSLAPFIASGNAQLSTAEKKFGTASLLLDGTDDFVTSDENIDLSSGDFTVDMWIRPTSVTGYKGLWQSGTSSLLNVYLIGNQVQGTVAGSTTLFLSSTRISANVWTMISVEREGNVHRLYINGVLEQSSSTANRPDNGVFAVGKNGFGDFNGYIDETRVSTVARYSGSSFTEPTAAFSLDTDTTALLHFDGANGSTTITNAASNVINFTLTGTANITLVGVEAVGSVNNVEDKPTEVLGSVSATGFVNDNFTFSNSHALTGVQGIIALGTIVKTAEVFNFQAVANQYSRARTIKIPRAA